MPSHPIESASYLTVNEYSRVYFLYGVVDLARQLAEGSILEAR